MSKDSVNLKLCLEKPYLQNFINKVSSDWIPQEEFSVCGVNSLCLHFVKKAAEIIIAYSEIFTFQLLNCHFGMVLTAHMKCYIDEHLNATGGLTDTHCKDKALLPKNKQTNK